MRDAIAHEHGAVEGNYPSSFPKNAKAQYDWFVKNNHTVSDNYRNAEAGDFIFWDRSGNNTKYHVGVVVRVTGEGVAKKVYVLSAQFNNGKPPTVKKEVELLKNGEQRGWGQPFVAIARMK